MCVIGTYGAVCGDNSQPALLSLDFLVEATLSLSLQWVAEAVLYTYIRTIWLTGCVNRYYECKVLTVPYGKKVSAYIPYS